MAVDYKWDEGQRVRVTATGKTGYVNCSVPGDGTGTGWYYVTIDDMDGGGEVGPLSADELEEE